MTTYRIKQIGVIGVIGALAMVLGCRRPAEKTAAQLTTDESLVQILIYGLAAFEFTDDDDGRPVAFVHMPPHEDHKVYFMYGVAEEGKRTWKPAGQNPAGKSILFPDLTGDFRVHDGGEPAQTKPRSSKDATGVKWMARYQKIDGGGPQIDRDLAEVHIELTRGTLETCGLVHGAKHDRGNTFRVCEMKFKGSGYRRAMSEYMVLRNAVPSTVTAMKVVLRAPDSSTVTQMIPVTDGAGATISWDDGTGAGEKVYNKFFDVLLANVPGGSVREMESGHGNILKEMFPLATKDWSLEAPECSYRNLKWYCDSCEQDHQPSCWQDYFKDYDAFPSGLDRPVCPFVGYP